MEVKVSKVIEGSQDRVFQVFTELEQAPQRIAGITNLEVLSEGPVGKGTRWRETRVMFGKEAVEEMEISDFQPSTGYAVEAESCGCLYQTSFDFEPEGSQTKVTMSFKSTPLTFFGRIMGFLMGGMMRKTMVKCMDADMSDLKAFIEA